MFIYKYIFSINATYYLMATTYPAKQRKKQHELEDATYNCVSVRYLESVTESKTEPIEGIRRMIERWGEKLVPHQDASGQVKKPRWSKCWEMWQELARVLNSDSYHIGRDRRCQL